MSIINDEDTADTADSREYASARYIIMQARVMKTPETTTYKLVSILKMNRALETLFSVISINSP
jgi:hypothetical protein